MGWTKAFLLPAHPCRLACSKRYQRAVHTLAVPNPRRALKTGPAVPHPPPSAPCTIREPLSQTHLEFRRVRLDMCQPLSDRVGAVCHRKVAPGVALRVERDCMEGGNLRARTGGQVCGGRGGGFGRRLCWGEEGGALHQGQDWCRT
eukprot:364195-Chlamydomonas_euryale.AAC.15